MYSQKELSAYFEEELTKQHFGGFPSQLYEPIEYTLKLGGKRIRPVLTLMGCCLFNNNISKALPQAIAIELFHNFTLIHDDIMDNAPVRRGKKTVFKKWNQNTAILSGDTLFAKAYQYAQMADKEILGDVLSVFSQTAIEVCEGQQLDLEFESRNDVTVAEYIEMIRLKTGVLFASSIKIGSYIGNAPKEDTENLYNFGTAIGLGFQLEDDLLDTYGDTTVFGKKTGGDIVTNKKTYLYLKALEKADNKTREQLIELYTKPQQDDGQKIQKAKGIFSDLGVDKDTTLLIDKYFNDSMHFLNKVNINQEKKKELRMVAERMVNRVK
ncbi:MAG: polyprenyl synthetase family protein [Bacteroidetes bacterium]|nr:MAG: polyprenyl synthetase family protein [Bacteroidota bacterium]